MNRETKLEIVNEIELRMSGIWEENIFQMRYFYLWKGTKTEDIKIKIDQCHRFTDHCDTFYI